jgi:VIT1/CCC1 family predicted Fe2+/Mn2+ transporter
MNNLISLLITIIIMGLVFYLLWWLLARINLPPPFNKVAQVIVALVAVVFLLSVLFGGISLPRYGL